MQVSFLEVSMATPSSRRSPRLIACFAFALAGATEKPPEERAPASAAT
jgi:hypothetical protein